MRCLFIGGPLDGKFVNVHAEWDHYSALSPTEPFVENLPQQPKIQIMKTTNYVKCKLYNGEYITNNVFVVQGQEYNVIKNLIEGYKAK